MILEIAHPSAIRRNVAFSEAVYEGHSKVEDMECFLAKDEDEAEHFLKENKLTMLIDPNGNCLKRFKPVAVVDAILAKKNLGTTRDMAPITIALGPGFTAGQDCDAVVETMRGHKLGRVIHEGKAIANTGVPGMIGGYAAERVIHAPAAGILHNIAKITDIVEEGHIGLDTADADLAHTTLGLAHRSLKGAVKGGDLYQQRIIVRGDLRTGEGIACVQTDAEAAAGTVGGELAGIRGKIVGGVLSGDTALDGIATQLDGILALDTDIGVGERQALGDVDLGPYQVDAGDHLGDGVLHLDAGVHFDEVVVAVLVHQEFHGTGVDIAHFLGDLDRIIIELPALFRGDAKGRGELHHLLVPALHRTVTLKEMHHIAVLVSEDLHFDVLGLLQELFHKDVVIAEGLAGFVSYQLKVPGDLLGIVSPAHASSALRITG